VLFHDFAPLEVLVEEVHDRVLQLRHVVQELPLDDLRPSIPTSRYSPTVRVYSLCASFTYSFILIRSPRILAMISRVSASSNSSS
jgi:hypothetical protein